MSLFFLTFVIGFRFHEAIISFKPQNTQMRQSWMDTLIITVEIVVHDFMIVSKHQILVCEIVRCYNCVLGPVSRDSREQTVKFSESLKAS